MRRLFQGTILTVLLGLFSLEAIPARPLLAQERVVIAIQPTLASDEMLTKAKPLKNFLEQGLGGKVNVEIYVPSSYAAVVESLRFGHAHVAFMSAWPAQLAVQLGGADVALAEVRQVLHGAEKVEAPYYYSYWVALPDSPHQSLQSLKGKSACFPSPISTSGYVAPMGRLAELNLLRTPEGKEADPKAFFKEVLFGGGYGQCWQALKQGQVDATIIAGDVPEKLYKEVLASTRILEQQGPIPSHAVVLSKELKEPLRSRVIQAIVKLGQAEHRDLMRSFISSIFVGFKPTTATEHLGSLTRYLKLARLKYTERL
ncbi:MAG: phosphate/phosphite/phosphonate ABC transporter substrate-binding protein [Deltaproteobacteria bacterium]|nr:phosphate/phosphite/phosphonate ABC transporter substrate-binding protein [Deltaproteobacteria bacterium]